MRSQEAIQILKALLRTNPFTDAGIRCIDADREIAILRAIDALAEKIEEQAP
jgi:hypothetical protein